MKRVRDTLFNKIFCKKALKEWKQYKEQVIRLQGWLPQMLQDLKEAKTLEDLLNVHKNAWKLGYQNNNLAPCEWGMFRTKSIQDMQPSEVYLGDIWGLLTKNILFWSKDKDITIGANGFGINENVKIYDLIMNQYRSHLSSNFRAIVNQGIEDILRR